MHCDDIKGPARQKTRRFGRRALTRPMSGQECCPSHCREALDSCTTYLKDRTHFSMSIPHLTGSTASARGARRSTVRVTARAADGLPSSLPSVPDMQRTSACEMPPLAALPEQLQPLPALRRRRRSEPARAGKSKEAAAGERERISCRQASYRACHDLARSIGYVRTDGVEVAQ